MKFIPGYEKLYSVTEDGQIFSHKSDRYLAIDTNQGDRRIRLALPGSRDKQFRVAVLMLLTYVGPKSEGAWCLHRDDNQMNDVIGNLRWGQPGENIEDRLNNGKPIHPSGKGKPKLSREDVIEIRRLSSEEKRSHASIAGRFEVSAMTISSIVRRVTWSHIDD